MSILDEEALELSLDPTHAVELKADDIVPMWRQRLRIFLHNKLAIASVAYLVLTLIFCYVGPLFYHTNQTNQATALSCLLYTSMLINSPSLCGCGELVSPL